MDLKQLFTINQPYNSPNSLLNYLVYYYNLLNMGYQKLINSNIKELRLKHHLTQEEFAEKIGISLQGGSNIERNRYQPTA